MLEVKISRPYVGECGGPCHTCGALVQSRNWWLLAMQLKHNCFLWI